MSVEAAVGDAGQRWIQWWCAPWQWAHPDWLARFAAASDLSPDLCAGLLCSRHGAFLHSVGIQPAQPPEPVAALLQWLALSAAQQQQALALAGRICLAPLNPAMTDDHGAEHEAWCRSVAKALRPGVWLVPGLNDPRLLLAAWVGEACWSRLRLAWSPEVLADWPDEALPELPAHKLHTLWQSVLWRIAAA
ncbi:type III secretion protein [Pseudomonas sp. NPDC090202]|uniref:type III secretion protein n=1 Tax=unclassified Pseudomonas TaxID=196821 RepID=UPI0037FECB4A